MSGDKPLRFAVVGCGRISQIHLSVLAAEPRVRLAAAADVDARVASSAGEAFGIPHFTDTDQMLETVGPDAIVLCTPPNSHRQLTELALSKGAHVLCEKPLAIDVRDAEEMVRASERAGRVLMMASKFRYVQDVIKAVGLLRSGMLGEIILFENEFCSHVDMKHRWNSRKEISGGGVLIDNGSHSVDIVRYLLGPIDSLQAVFGKHWQDLEVEDTCQLFLRCVDGTVADIQLSWSIQKDSPYFIRVYGAEGLLEVGWKQSRYRQHAKQDWVVFGEGYDKVRAVAAQLSNFIDTIQGISQPVIGSTDAIESVRVVQAAYRSAEHNRWEKVAS